jgi:hypothetical protein
MYRIALSLLLLPCILVNQYAAYGHAHKGMEAAGHEARPHVHFAEHSHANQHEHVHGPDGHHHDHDHDHDAPQDHSESFQKPSSNDDHNKDVLYVTCTDVTNQSVEKDDVSASLEFSGLATHLESATARVVSAIEMAWTWAQPPPPHGISCQIYLWHVSLLI